MSVPTEASLRNSQTLVFRDVSSSATANISNDKLSNVKICRKTQTIASEGAASVKTRKNVNICVLIL